MATEVTTTNANLATPFESLLSGLRRKIQTYVWIQGLSLGAAWLGLAFWITLGLDWLVEPPPVVRGLVLVAVAGILGWIIYRYILARAFVRMDDTSMAVLLERRYGSFRDSLLTTIELGGKPAHADPFNRDMLRHTRDEALRQTADVRLSDVFRSAALMRGIFAAVLMMASVGVFAGLAPDAFRVWVNRVLLLSQELWPRKTHMSIEGFTDRRVKVARGSDFKVLAHADRRFGYIVPETVLIRYRSDEGNPGRENMNQESAGPSSDRQPYSFEFKGVLSTITFDVVGGDDRLRDYKIEVVDNPTIAETTLHCVYPPYMNRGERDLRVAGLMQIPMGTQITIRAKSNKPLQEVKVERVDGQTVDILQSITSFTDQERRSFEVVLPALREDARLQFRLHDTDNIWGRDPVRLDLTPVPDDAPKVGLQLQGISSAITPQARLPVSGEVNDDYGLGRIWFEYQVDQTVPNSMSFLVQAPGKSTLKIERAKPEAFDLKELADAPELKASAVDAPLNKAAANNAGTKIAETKDTGSNDVSKPVPLVLKDGQRLTLLVKAADLSTLADQPNVGLGERYVLDVVTPDQLLAMLEARELQLRQRFETIIDEFSATRDFMAKLQIAGRAKPKSDAPRDDRGRVKGAEPGEDRSKLAPGAEPGDTTSPLSPGEGNEERAGESTAGNVAQSAAQARASVLLALERSVENFERSAYETRTVGQSFLDIREEMENNRIDTPALQNRLKDEIADPLLLIANQRMPVLQKRLVELQKIIDNTETAPAKLDEAVREATAILEDMRLILDKMIEMATINELVEKLRKVIEQQNELNKETKRQQLDKLRNLTD